MELGKIEKGFYGSLIVVESFKNNFNLMELYNRNIINGEDNIGELLTGNADDNTEGIEQSSP